MPITTVILDRDGVINHDSKDYIKTPDEFLFINKSLDAIYILYQNNIKIFIATNQSGINRGLYNLNDFLDINNKLLNNIKQKFNKNIITSIYYCPHPPEQKCLCRKPLPGMINKIKSDHNIDLTQTAFVGDSYRDIEAAHLAGCQYKYLVKTGKGLETIDKLESLEKKYCLPSYNITSPPSSGKTSPPSSGKTSQPSSDKTSPPSSDKTSPPSSDKTSPSSRGLTAGSNIIKPDYIFEDLYSCALQIIKSEL